MKIKTAVIAVVVAAVLASGALGARANASDSLESYVSEIKITHELLRGLEYGFEPAFELLDAKEARARASRLSRLMLPFAPDADMRSTAAAWEFLRLMPEGYDLEGAIDGFARARARAFYDPEARAVVLARDMSAPGWNTPLIKKTMEVLEVTEPEFALAFQYSLALLDSNFNIYEKLSVPGMSADARMAAVALPLGDAAVMAMDYIVRNYGVSALLLPNVEAVVSQFIPMVSYIPRADLKAAPEALARDAAFPYSAGVRFASALRSSGGGPLINSAYASLPISSEQILHPEKYFETRDNPAGVEMPDLRAALPEGSVKIYEETLGEWGLRRMLAAWMKDDTEASSAASGWAGDRFAMYETPDGARAGAFFTTWDSAPDAELFVGVFRRAARAAFAAAAHVETAVIGRDAAIVVAPSADAATALMELVWQSMKVPSKVPPPVPQQPDPTALITQLSQFMGMFSNTEVKPPSGDDWREDGDVFINSKHKYKLRRPAPEWNFQRLHLGNQFVSEFTAVNTKSAGSNFTIFTFAKYAPDDPDNPVDQMVDFMAAQMQGFKKIEDKKTTVAGAPARSVTFTGSMFVPLKITYTEVFGPDFTHVITWWAVRANYDALLPDYARFMESFEFLN